MPITPPPKEPDKHDKAPSEKKEPQKPMLQHPVPPPAEEFVEEPVKSRKDEKPDRHHKPKKEHRP